MIFFGKLSFCHLTPIPSFCWRYVLKWDHYRSTDKAHCPAWRIIKITGRTLILSRFWGPLPWTLLSRLWVRLGTYFLSPPHWVFVAACGLSLVKRARAPLPLWHLGFSLRRLLLLLSRALGHKDFSSCSMWALEQGLRSCDALLLWDMWDHNSQTRGQNHVLCIDGRILYHLTIKEVSLHFFFFHLFLLVGG